ncbi:hypothetical protein V9T40_012754 [Parthenolecanium corni]|uniref:Uncharacterized protein n=1 Tax=Parthenolecanium corni TaxID=536013 RepID=A0AAN9Y0V5_9HEMI
MSYEPPTGRLQSILIEEVCMTLQGRYSCKLEARAIKRDRPSGRHLINVEAVVAAPSARGRSSIGGARVKITGQLPVKRRFRSP